MPGTFSQILLHIVFATKGRWPWLTPPVRGRMHAFLGGIVRDEGGVALAVGGVSDHVHLLVRWKPDGKLSDLLRNLKSRSSLWAHQELVGLGSFAWQEGYAVFSVSKSGEAQVKAYIENQEQHHKAKDYREEILELFRLHEIAYEQERFVVEELDARLAPAGAPKASTIVATGGCPEGAGTRGKEAKTSPPPRRGGRLLGLVMAAMMMAAMGCHRVHDPVHVVYATRKGINELMDEVKKTGCVSFGEPRQGGGVGHWMLNGQSCPGDMSAVPFVYLCPEKALLQGKENVILAKFPDIGGVHFGVVRYDYSDAEGMKIQRLRMIRCVENTKDANTKEWRFKLEDVLVDLQASPSSAPSGRQPPNP